MATDLTTTELDAFRDDADRFIAELDEEYYLHLAGHKETLDLEQIYERARGADEARDGATARRRADRAVALRLRGFPRRPHARARRDSSRDVESELEATVDGEQIPYRMLRVAMSNEPDRDRRERLERARLDLLDEHLNPVYLDAARIDREAVARLGVAELLRALQAVRLPRSTSWPRECTALLDETERTVGAGRRPPLPRAARDRRSPTRAPSDVARLFRAPELDSRLPRRPDAAGARGDAGRPRDRPARAGRTSTSTSSSAPARARARSARRSRCPGR